MSATYDSDDEDVKRAIALSLLEADGANGGKSTDPIIIVEEEEESVPKPEPKNTYSTARHEVAATEPVATKLPGIFGLDRKAMEQERLARLAKKRKASDSISPPPMNRSKKLTPPQHIIPTPTKVITVSSPTSSQASNRVVPAPSTSSPVLPYPCGVVKKTWCLGFPREGDDIKIEEVLQRSQLKLAVLSSFQWDMEWLESKLDLPRIKLVLVMQAKDEATRRQWRHETANRANFRICFPPMPGNVSCMHSKLMLLGYEGYLRVVVPTANLTRYDWGETGVMENSVFLIDLPKKNEKKTSDGECAEGELGLFAQELVYFCKAQGMDNSIIESLHDFDYSETHGLAFVHSIGGDHVGTDSEEPWRRTGYCGLGRSVSALGLNTDDELEIDFVASSIGAVNEDFLLMLYLACQGDEGSKEFSWRTNAPNILKHIRDKAHGLAKARSKPLEVDTAARYTALGALEANLRIYFPSRETVMQSKGGAKAAGVICFNPRWYESVRFPKRAMRDCKSTREGLLMHNKYLYVRPKGLAGRTLQSRAWAYIGSANCSESAWGKLTFNKTTKQMKLNCRNWECGVIMPVSRYKAAPPEQPVISDSLDVYSGVVPVPMRWPGDTYDGRQPWYFGGFG